MKKDFLISVFLVFVVTLSSGCATLVNNKLYDEIFTYEVPYDRGFLQILEAGDDAPGWSLEATSKAEGLVMFRQAGSLGERATLIVKNIDKNIISIEVAKESQSVKGVGELLRSIDQAFLLKEKMKKVNEDQEQEAS